VTARGKPTGKSCGQAIEKLTFFIFAADEAGTESSGKETFRLSHETGTKKTWKFLAKTKVHY
jgi:hypothetical protein